MNSLIHPLLSKCVLVASIWCEMSAWYNGKKIPSISQSLGIFSLITRHLLELLSPMIILACIFLKEKGCKSRQSDEVAYRATLLAVLSFWMVSSQFLPFTPSIFWAFCSLSKQQPRKPWRYRFGSLTWFQHPFADESSKSSKQKKYEQWKKKRRIPPPRIPK